MQLPDSISVTIWPFRCTVKGEVKKERSHEKHISNEIDWWGACPCRRPAHQPRADDGAELRIGRLRTGGKSRQPGLAYRSVSGSPSGADPRRGGLSRSDCRSSTGCGRAF